MMICENDIGKPFVSLNNDIGLLDSIIKKMNPQQKETEELSCVCKRLKKEIQELFEMKSEKLSIKREVIGDLNMKDVRVLVIDDNKQMNEHTTELMERYSVKTDVVTTVEEAFQLYEQETYDIVLLSIYMDPIRVAKRIRKQGERGKRQFIVGLLKYPDYDLQQELLAFGVEVMLYTPIQSLLIETILKKEFYDKIESRLEDSK